MEDCKSEKVVTDAVSSLFLPIFFCNFRSTFTLVLKKADFMYNEYLIACSGSSQHFFVKQYCQFSN